MGIIKKLIGLATTASMLLLAAPVGAAPSGGYSLFGEASLVSPGNNSPTAVQTVSDDDPGFGGIDFTVPEGLTFDQLDTLATDYNVTDDSCAAGSPRYQINLDTDGDGDTDGSAFSYIGPPPSYTGCPTGWQSTGNLVEDTDLIDTSQLGGAFYEPVLTAQTRLAGATITGIQLVTDSGFAFPDGEQTILFDNAVINDTTIMFESAESCKKGGWQQFTSEPGPFKNQGQCVSYFARQQ